MESLVGILLLPRTNLTSMKYLIIQANYNSLLLLIQYNLRLLN